MQNASHSRKEVTLGGVYASQLDKLPELVQLRPVYGPQVTGLKDIVSRDPIPYDVVTGGEKTGINPLHPLPHLRTNRRSGETGRHLTSPLRAGTPSEESINASFNPGVTDPWAPPNVGVIICVPLQPADPTPPVNPFHLIWGITLRSVEYTGFALPHGVGSLYSLRIWSSSTRWSITPVILFILFGGVALRFVTYICQRYPAIRGRLNILQRGVVLPFTLV